MKPKTFRLKSGTHKISVKLYKKGKETQPLVIFCHGLGGSQNSKKVKKLLPKLLKKNIALLTFDLAHHGESTGKIEKLTIKQSLLDLKTVLNYAVKNKQFKNINIIASSYGGLITLITATKRKDINSIVLLAPLTDFKNNTKQLHDIISWKRKGFTNLWDIKINYSFYDSGIKHGILKNPEKITAPTMIIHGNKDSVVPISFSRKFYNKLKCAKKFVVIKNSDHDWVEHLDNVISNAVSWINLHKKNNTFLTTKKLNTSKQINSIDRG